MATFTVIADEISFKSGEFHSFTETRKFVEGNKMFDDVNKLVVVEDNNGECKIHEYFKFTIN